MLKYILAFFLPLLLAYGLTPVAKKVAYLLGAIDIPKDDRRVHKKPIPRLGGIAIFMAAIISIVLVAEVTNQILFMIIGATIITVSGIIDDVKPMSAKLKMLFQIVASAFVIYGGVLIETFKNPISDGYIFLGVLGIPITIFWIVGITNTINLIDGLDGLSAGVSAISATTLAIISFLQGDKNIGIICLIIAGSAIGFLPFNFNPASIFMGDTGALFLGFMLSTLAIEGALKEAAIIAIIPPVLSLGLPVFDTAFAILRRYKNKRPIMEADRGHLHHRLLDLGLGQRKTVIILYTINAVYGICAIIMTQMKFINGVIFLGLICIVTVVLLFKLRNMGRKLRKR